MTGRTITIQGSDEVMAMLGRPGTFFRGKWRDVIVTKVGEDKDTPLSVRKSLVGLTVPIIFDKQQLKLQGVNLGIPNNSILAYSIDVINALKSAKKYEEAKRLEIMTPNLFDMYVFESGTYEIL